MYYNNFNLNDLFDEFGKAFDDITTTGVLDFDVVNNEDEYLLYVDVPGYEKSDLSIKFEDDVLTLKVPARESKGNVLKERARKESVKSYTFKNVDKKSIKANLENGILMVKLGKLPKSTSEIIVE